MLLLAVHKELFLIDGAKKLVMLILDGKVDNLSADNHDEDELLENIHKLVLGARIILGQRYFR